MSKRQAHGQPAKRSGKVVKEAGADVKGPAAKNKRSRDVHEAPIDYKGQYRTNLHRSILTPYRLPAREG